MIQDRLNIARVANGWVIAPAGSVGNDEFSHVYVTPEALAEHVRRWADAQTMKTTSKPESNA